MVVVEVVEVVVVVVAVVVVVVVVVFIEVVVVVAFSVVGRSSLRFKMRNQIRNCQFSFKF